MDDVTIHFIVISGTTQAVGATAGTVVAGLEEETGHVEIAETAIDVVVAGVVTETGAATAAVGAEVLTVVAAVSCSYRERNYRGRVSNFDQSEARKQCFLASDWLKFETLPRQFRTL